MGQAAFTLSQRADGIVALTFDLPDKGANVLSNHVLAEFATHLDALEQRTDLQGLIIRSGKPGMFIAGADLREFVAAKDATQDWVVQMCRQGQQLFQRLSKCPFVTVAAIDGICLGGGTELSLWCDRRLMTSNPKAQLGLPEVKLGLFPGWGGTARLPRIVGLSNAIEIISGGESIDGQTAYQMGLVTDVVRPAQLDEAAVALIQAEQASGQYLRDRETWGGPIDISEQELVFLGATGSAYIQQQTKGHYPAPLAALETMLGAAGENIDAACEAEAAGMAQLFGSPINRALLNVFFLSDRNKKDTGIERGDVPPGQINSLAVYGAGIMGSSIAAVAVKASLPVAISDTSAESLARGVEHLLEEVAYNKQTKGLDAAKAIKFAPLVNATQTDSEMAGCDLVLEAIVENVDIKQQLYARVEPLLGKEAILATNTSTIPIERLAARLKHPERFVGIHFFNPVRKMPLVEVIRGPQTSDQTVATAVAFAKKVRKSPIVVYDGPGFLVNRCLFPYLNEALHLLQDGASPEAVEKAAKEFGMPMGPLTLYDVIGIDTAVYAGRVMYESFPERCEPTQLILTMLKRKRLGQKTGAGFYRYDDKQGRGKPDPEFQELLAPLVRTPDRKFSKDEITHRLFLPMLLEATRVLEEKRVRDPRDVDLGLIYGIGFPPFRGGLLFWADQIGAKKILEWLQPLQSCGARLEPTDMLQRMAESGEKFYAQ